MQFYLEGRVREIFDLNRIRIGFKNPANPPDQPDETAYYATDSPDNTPVRCVQCDPSVVLDFIIFFFSWVGFYSRKRSERRRPGLVRCLQREEFLASQSGHH